MMQSNANSASDDDIRLQIQQQQQQQQQHQQIPYRNYSQNSANNNNVNYNMNNVSLNSDRLVLDATGNQLSLGDGMGGGLHIPYIGGGHALGDSTGGGRGGSSGHGGHYEHHDNKSIASTPSKISKFTYSEYPQIKPTNPLYTSTATIKTATSAVSRASTMNTVSRRQKYNPNRHRRLYDWRWVAALAILLFFPTGLIAFGLAVKARIKFADGFIDDAKKLNERAFVLCIVSFVCGMAWILTAFFMMDKWPRTYG